MDDRQAVHRGAGTESEILLRQLDSHLAWVRSSSPEDFPLAERIAVTLRRLVDETVRSSAADRAMVRAAVHFVVVRKHRMGSARHPQRPVSADVPVLNEIVAALGRDDLALQHPRDVGARASASSVRPKVRSERPPAARSETESLSARG
jgi:hypothetical protein